MVVQGIKDRSKVREHMVMRKQGDRDESETREGEQGETQRWVFVGKRRSGEDPGKIHRSYGGSGFLCS